MGKSYDVQIILGSENDRKIVDESGIFDILQKELKVTWQLHYISAHRNKEALRTYCLKAKQGREKVFIVAAGMMPALPGDVAGWTDAEIPVIGVVLDSSTILGKDTIVTAVSMPQGTPVVYAGIGKSGLVNAAIAAAQVVAVGDPIVRHNLSDYRERSNPVPVISAGSSDTYQTEKCLNRSPELLNKP